MSELGFKREVVLTRDFDFGDIGLVKYHNYKLEENKSKGEEQELSSEVLKAVEWYLDCVGECYSKIDVLQEKGKRSLFINVSKLINEFFHNNHLSKNGKETIKSIRVGFRSNFIYSYNLIIFGDEIAEITLPIAMRDQGHLKDLYCFVIEKAFYYFLDSHCGEDKECVFTTSNCLLFEDESLISPTLFAKKTFEAWPGGFPDFFRDLFDWSETKSNEEEKDWLKLKLQILNFAESEGFGNYIEGSRYQDIRATNVVFGPKFCKEHRSQIDDATLSGIRLVSGIHKAGLEALQYPQMFLPIPKYKARKISEGEWDALYESRPNFHEVTDYVRAYVKRNELLSRPFRMPPILLDGPPGIGKTSYARKIADILGLPSHLESAQNLCEGFDLAGSSSVYSDSTPGLIFNTISQAKCLNPILIFDEVDKMSNRGERGVSVENTMLSLLERETSSEFVEHFFRTTMDASWINWIMTSNDVNLCPTHLRSRLKIFHIKNPNQDEVSDVIQSIYKNVMISEEMTGYFESTLNELSLQKLREFDLREIKRRIEQGLNQCILEASELSGHMTIKPSHLEEKRKKRNIFR